MIELVELPPQLDRLVLPKDFKDRNHPMMTVVSLWRRIWQWITLQRRIFWQDVTVFAGPITNELTTKKVV